MKSFLTKSLVASLLVTASVTMTPANSALVDVALPDNAFISFGGLDWAWATPLQGAGQTPSSTLDLSFQSQFGWRLPTLDELANSAPDAIDFVFAGANVPFNGPPVSNTNPGTNIDPVSGALFNFTTPSDIVLAGDAACATPYFNTTFSSCNWRQGKGNGSFPSVFTAWAGEPGSFATSEQLVVREQLSVVPLPAALPLYGTGLALMGFIGWRRRQRKVAA